MAIPLDILALIIFGIVSIAALLGNGFIIVVNSHSWLQRRKLVPCDFLLTWLSITRFLMQCFTLSGHSVYFNSPMYYMCWYKVNGIGLGWIYFSMFSFSGTTCLVVFYCVKVTTFAHHFFIWLKSRIDRFVPSMVLMSVIAFFLFSIPSALEFQKNKTFCNLKQNVTVYMSSFEALEEATLVIFQSLLFSFSAINFSICLTASVLLIVSLWWHTKNMKKSSLNTEDIRTQAHLKILRLLAFFLFFYILYFIMITITVYNIIKFGKVERLITDIYLSLCSSAHSIILIWTNRKLKGAFIRFLLCRER